MKRAFSAILCVILLSSNAAAFGLLNCTDEEAVDAAVFEETEIGESLPDITAPSAILIEKETGTVLFEKNADEVREPASVTKIMTILLIVEAIEAGTVSPDDTVTASTYASSMGGSQIYLREGEKMLLDDMLKSIVVASANDAAVAVAEHICGSEQAFVSRMNQRASELGMENTVFKNCTGLFDDREHVTTARDIAVMSRELLQHDLIRDYTTIWTDTVRGGEFGLTNTNKLVRFYNGATGLKTGFTSRSMYCMSASAERDGVEFIAVVMGEETSAARFETAKTLLGYAFSNFALVNTAPDEAIAPIEVRLGSKKHIQPVPETTEPLVCAKKDAQSIEKTVELFDTLTAPVDAGQKVGTMRLTSGDKLICEISLVSSEAIKRLTWFEIFLKYSRLLYSDYCTE